MINPTVGRKVWYWPTVNERTSFGLGDDATQPLDASICYVVHDRCINIGGHDARGRHFARSGVLLLQGDEEYEPVTSHCAWMPYQVGQAKQDQPKGKKDKPLTPA